MRTEACSTVLCDVSVLLDGEFQFFVIQKHIGCIIMKLNRPTYKVEISSNSTTCI